LYYVILHGKYFKELVLLTRKKAESGDKGNTKNNTSQIFLTYFFK